VSNEMNAWDTPEGREAVKVLAGLLEWEGDAIEGPESKERARLDGEHLYHEWRSKRSPEWTSVDGEYKCSFSPGLAYCILRDAARRFLPEDAYIEAVPHDPDEPDFDTRLIAAVLKIGKEKP